MPSNNPFSASEVMTVSVQGLREAQANLERINAELNPNGMRSTLNLAAGMVHRYLMGLGQDTPPIQQRGVLPVITGRLKNSFFWGVRVQAGEAVGFVQSNIAYGPRVNDRRQFVERTVKDMEQPVLDLVGARVEQVISRKTG